MDVTGNDDLLLVRALEKTKYTIQIINRITEDLINKFPSICDHSYTRVCRHPQNQDYAYESCPMCEYICAYNIISRERFPVHKGSKIVRMCDGPDGSLLVMNTDWELFKLYWDKNQQETQSVFIQGVATIPGKHDLLFRYCYIEFHGIFMYTVKDVKDDYELIAMKLGSNIILWRLYGPVNGRVIKPESVECDTDGNAYVNDQGNSRILKINSLTGEVLSILLFEEEEMKILSMR